MEGKVQCVSKFVANRDTDRILFGLKTYKAVPLTLHLFVLPLQKMEVINASAPFDADKWVVTWSDYQIEAD